MSPKQELIRQPQETKDLVQEIQNMKNLAETLIKTKHYQQLGPDGIFAVIQKAKSLNINPLEALNGGLYYVQGRVEMSAQMMNQLIRSKGHSIQKDPKSTKELCLLHGKRADNSDVWSVQLRYRRCSTRWDLSTKQSLGKIPGGNVLCPSVVDACKAAFPRCDPGMLCRR
jgi:hypothetical protein